MGQAVGHISVGISGMVGVMTVMLTLKKADQKARL